MQNAIVNVNGQILTPAEANVSAFDRGYLYGDSLYEVARTYGGKLYLLDEHLARLESSAKLARMILGQSAAQYREECVRTVRAFHGMPGQGGREAYCRLIVSRGTGKIGFGLNCLTSPTLFTIIVQPLDAPGEAQYKRGAHLAFSERVRNDRRALDPAMKSGNYLNSLLAFLEANAADQDDAILCDYEGHVTEGTTFNVFYVRRGIVATPPLDIGILDGLTRRQVLAHCSREGIPFRETRFPRERMFEADECFLTSTIKEVFPITQLDGKPVADGAMGPVTRRLLELFRADVPKGLS
jgi:branched-chain amino acid aminotransferase